MVAVVAGWRVGWLVGWLAGLAGLARLARLGSLVSIPVAQHGPFAKHGQVAKHFPHAFLSAPCSLNVCLYSLFFPYSISMKLCFLFCFVLSKQ